MAAFEKVRYSFLALHINDRFNGIDEVTLLLLATLFRLGLALL